MKINESSATLSRIKTEMVILRDSFQALNNSMGAMLAAMPDSERDILQNRWSLIAENFEEMFSNYLK